MNIQHSTANLRKSGLVGLLERICQALELTPTQQQMAQDRYESVGQWLSQSRATLLQTASIYAQGSVALGTTNRPVGQNEHDVDLVCFVPEGSSLLQPGVLKGTIGDRLRENGHYAPILEEKSRCWRLNYANEFHLDITPSIRNPMCGTGGELVPDRLLKEWKATNPKGYRSLFEKRANIQPRLTTFDFAAMSKRAADANLEPYPIHSSQKGPLRRIVQLAKRNRDLFFIGPKIGLAPISVIVTTLASRSYEHCATQNVYENEFDLLLDVIMLMPQFIQTEVINGHTYWFIWNETTAGENFAEKWNSDSALAVAFFEWHRTLVSDLRSAEHLLGMDILSKQLASSFGDAPVSKAMRMITDEVSSARAGKHLAVAAGLGLTTAIATGTAVRANTFFGAE